MGSPQGMLTPISTASLLWPQARKPCWPNGDNCTSRLCVFRSRNLFSCWTTLILIGNATKAVQFSGRSPQAESLTSDIELMELHGALIWCITQIERISHE